MEIKLAPDTHKAEASSDSTNGMSLHETKSGKQLVQDFFTPFPFQPLLLTELPRAFLPGGLRELGTSGNEQALMYLSWGL